MASPEQTDNTVASPNIEQLLDSSNSASQSVAALHVGFLAFLAYFGVIVWGTTHEDMLRVSPVKLPILDVELPLTAFYQYVPWLLVLLHFNLLIQLELLSCKLWNLDRALPDSPAGQQVRDRLFIFPFTHLIAGRSDSLLIRWLMALVVGITVIALPLFMLLAAQIRFLPFHGETITWSERLAVWSDIVMLLALWPLIASPQDRAFEWWRNAARRLFGEWFRPVKDFSFLVWAKLKSVFQPHPKNIQNTKALSKPTPNLDPKCMIILLVSIPIVLMLSLIAVCPGSITLQSYYNPEEPASDVMNDASKPSYFEDWLIRKAPQSWLSVAVYQYDSLSCASLPEAEKTDASILQVMLGPCFWHELGLFPRNLDLKEAKLTPKEISLSLLTRATDPNKAIRDDAFKEFEGLNLQGRDLRFANLYGAVLPRADLRHVQLQGAVLLKAKLQGIVGWDKTQLQGAILGGTQLQGAGLIDADLRNADLRGADLQGADLGWAKLTSADLRGADLRGANLQGAKMQAIDLRGAKLHGANLQEANLQDSSLDFANLQGAELNKTNLQTAVLYKTGFEGADWSEANVDGTFVSKAPGSAGNSHQQRDLAAQLKPLLSVDKFTALEARLTKTSRAIPPNPANPKARCYSDDPDFLACDYRQAGQLAAFRAEVLYPKLVELACSDPIIAIGIARRSLDDAITDDSLPGLAEVLAKTLHKSETCVGLAALPQPTKDKLVTKAK